MADQARGALRAYYVAGEHAAGLVERMIGTAAGLRDAITGYADLGADEVVAHCWSAGPDRVGRPADVVG